MIFPSLDIGEDGWCSQSQVRRLPSANFDARAVDAKVDLLVIHNISLPPGQFGGEFICDLFTNRLDCSVHPYFQQLVNLRVSAHFLILRDGSIIQFVSANDRAWHAGASNFEGRERCNDFSVGIELEGTDFEPFEEIQYKMLAALTYALKKRYPLTHVTGHEHIAPGRKTDPGPYFNWQYYQECYSESGQLAVIDCSESDSLRFPAIN